MLRASQERPRRSNSVAIGDLISKHVKIAAPSGGQPKNTSTPESNNEVECRLNGTKNSDDTVDNTYNTNNNGESFRGIHKRMDNSGETTNQKATFDRICILLRSKIGSEVYQSWFGRMQLEPSSPSVVKLSVPTPFLRTWINSHYLDDVLELWQTEEPSVLKIEIVVRTAARSQTSQPSEAAKLAPVASPAQLGTKHPSMAGMATAKSMHTTAMQDQGGRGNVLGSPIDSRYSFDNFIEGASNNVCLAAARTAVDKGANSARFNPLFFYSSVGLGKTHLLQAIANAAKAKDPNQRVVYLTAEYFMWRFASAIRDSKALVFKEALNEIDLLIIDDMQFLQGEKIQSEFCHLINTLLDSAKQVVVAADRPPSELESLDPRVRSRLKGGVALEIEAPDYNMRLAMLEKRLEDARKEDASLIITREVMEHVAKTVSSSFRELEGAFNQLVFRQSFEPNISLDRVDDILGHLTRAEERKKVRIEDIQRIVAQHFNVPRNEMLSNRRTRTVVRPRQIAMYLSKILTPRSLPEIGRRFGGRDHTTVLHAVRKVEEMKSGDTSLSKELELLRRLIEE